MSFNLAVILTETALATPGAPVHRFMGNATTYGELDGQSGRFAAGLREAGLEPGDVVALQLPNVPQFLIAYFGALKATSGGPRPPRRPCAAAGCTPAISATWTKTASTSSSTGPRTW